MEGTFPNAYGRNKIHPQTFALLVACASIMMMFAAWTSAFMVRQAAGNWLEFSLPQVFTLSTVLILLSSFTLHVSYRAFLKGNEKVYQYGLVISLVLGLSFLYTQYQGWLALSAIGVELTTNPSGSFVYVFSYVHAAHVVGGLAILLLSTLHAFSLGLKVTPKRKHRFELSMIYWHFVDLLWVYIFFFLMTQM
jgi:cytochrome c oxidase subunit 3